MNKLLEKRNKLYSEASQLVELAKNETRSFSDDEKTRYESLVAEIRAIDAQINTENEFRQLYLSGGKDVGNENNDKEQREIRSFEAYILKAVGKVKETRDASPVNMTYGANGAIIPDTIMNKVIDRVVQISPLFAAATKYSVKGDVTIPKIDRSSGNITVAFASEFSSLVANGFKFTSINLSGHLAAALVLVSKQLINNSDRVDVVGVVIEKMAEEIAIFIENFLINGDSNISNSGIAGSIDSNNLISISTVASMTADNLIDVQDAVPDQYQKDAFWIMNSTVRTKIRKLKDGQGNYLLVPDFQAGSGYLLLGKSVFVTDNMATASSASAGDPLLYYGDFSGLAVKMGETAELQLLIEKYAEQHALGLNTWFEIDARIENTQKIAGLRLTPAQASSGTG